jgi:hypothetical protein
MIEKFEDGKQKPYRYCQLKEDELLRVCPLFAHSSCSTATSIVHTAATGKHMAAAVPKQQQSTSNIHN